MISFHQPYINNKFLKNLNKLLKVKSGLNYNFFQKKLKNLIKKKFRFKNVLFTNSCTSSLEIIALIIKNNNKKGNIVMPSYNYPTTASAFIRAGLDIKFIDIEGYSLMSSYDQYLQSVDKNTVAILTTHYAGLNVPFLEQLKKLCTKKKIFLVEDSAQALGSYHNKKPLGSFGDFSTFSFHETKNVHSVTGGMLICKNKKMHNIAKFILDRGTDRAKIINGRKNKYEWVTLGSAFNMTDIQAAMLYDQINNLKNIKNQRKKLYNLYTKYFKTFELSKYFYFNKIDDNKNYHCIYIILKNNIRSQLIEYLKKKGIESYVGYSPLHNSIFYKKIKKIELKKTEQLSNRVLRLPLHNYLIKQNIYHISNCLMSFFKRNRLK